MSNHLPKPTAQVAPYVEVLGTDLAVEFLLTFGGAEIYITADPRSRSRVVELIGRRKAVALAALSDRLPRRVPLAKPWVASVLHAKGLSKQEIARRLHVNHKTVRRYLMDAPAPGRGSSGGPEQLSLF